MVEGVHAEHRTPPPNRQHYRNSISHTAHTRYTSHFSLLTFCRLLVLTFVLVVGNAKTGEWLGLARHDTAMAMHSQSHSLTNTLTLTAQCARLSALHKIKYVEMKRTMRWKDYKTQPHQMGRQQLAMRDEKRDAEEEKFVGNAARVPHRRRRRCRFSSFGIASLRFCAYDTLVAACCCRLSVLGVRLCVCVPPSMNKIG